MKPEQALQNLIALARQAPVNYEAHAIADQSARVLQDFLKSKEEPTVEVVKSE